MHYQIIEIVLDMDLAELLFDSAGLILEAQALRSDGNLTVIYDLTEEEMARIEKFLNHMDISYMVRRPRHRAS